MPADIASSNACRAFFRSGSGDSLAIIAAATLLFTGRYPAPVFDFLLGLNRWVLRVTAYASLMTDSYPPFRLDMGGADPAWHDTQGSSAA